MSDATKASLETGLPTPVSGQTLILNGARVDVDVGRFDPTHTTLSQFLRQLHKTGTKEGCAEGDCGACTVAVADVQKDGSPGWRAVTSCIAPLGLFLGREVVTAEGLASSSSSSSSSAGDGEGLHPVQAAMVRHLGSQCGYCTPGFVVSMFEGFERPELSADDHGAISDQLCGNLCRCTGYRPIRDAMCHALKVRDAGVVDDDLVAIGGARTCGPRARHKETPSERPAVDVAGPRGRLIRPTSLDAILQLKREHGHDAVLVGGATELGVLLRKRRQSWPLLVDTGGIAEWRTVERGDFSGVMDGSQTINPADHIDAWRVGGAVTLASLEEYLLDDADMAPVVRMLRVFASRQVKNAGTLAGNLVTASPIGDMAPVLLALGAALELRTVDGARVVPLDAFFVGYRQTVLQPDEVVHAIYIPHPRVGARFQTYKVSKRRELDIAIVSAAFLIETDDAGVITRARLGFGGVAATPALARKAAEPLLGQQLADVRGEVRLLLEQSFTPLSDVRADKGFRSALVPSLWDRFCDDVAAGRSFALDAADGPDGVLGFDVEGYWSRADASRALLHDSGVGHVTGAARYVDDLARPDALHVWPVQSKLARGVLKGLDVAAALKAPGVRLVLTAADIPGHNDVGAIRHDEPLLVAVEGEVQHQGQLLALVVAETLAEAEAAAALVEVEIEALPPILGIKAAIAAQSFHPRLDGVADAHQMRKGDVKRGLSTAAQTLAFEVEIGGQEHFYLESQAAYAEVGDEGDVQLWSSTQHPSEVQAVVSHVLDLPRHQIVVTSPRMGGGFGGKETQGNAPAALAALAALRLKRPVRLQWDRDVDMSATGKRHPFYGRVEVGFTTEGKITALRAEIYADAGFALDLSESIHDRAFFHLDNCYDLENVEISGRVCRTNTVSHTAYRGFGGPQGMLLIEDTMTRIAQVLGKDGAEVRQANFYPDRRSKIFGTTPYHQVVDDFRVAEMWPKLLRESEYDARRAAVTAFNESNTRVKRGLAVTPVKFGISFTASFLNQAGALVMLYRDGSVQVNHGGTEMGQGLYTKILGVAMRELGVPRDRVRVMQTRTDKVPNTSATAASSGADLNGAAVKIAIDELTARLRPIAAILLEQKLGRAVHAGDVVFLNGTARANSQHGPELGVPFATVCEQAYLRQVPLSATGYYRTPDIGYDKKAGRGKPFHYFAYGCAVAEVEVDGTTGMRRVRRVDILHDVGDSLNPAVDRGQVEGAFVQGMGWLTSEELKWTDDGRLLSHSASTYQIPTIGDAPAVFRVKLWDDVVDDAAQPDVVHGSKAVGEPPFMLAFSVREAIKDAIAAFADREGHDDGRHVVTVHSPLTHEAIFAAVQRARGQHG